MYIYMCDRLSDDRRVSNESLSSSRLGGLSLAHNKHGSKSPGDEARAGERRSGLPKTMRNTNRHTRRATIFRASSSHRPVGIIMLAETFCPFTLRQDGGGVTFRTYDAYGFGRSLFCGLEAFQISYARLKNRTSPCTRTVERFSPPGHLTVSLGCAILLRRVVVYDFLAI